jgi:hypothetical protein
MQETLMEMQVLMEAVSGQLKSPKKTDKTVAIKNLRRIADLATTLAFTIEAQR